MKLNEKQTINRKFYVGFACYGAAVGIGILLCTFLIVFGFEKYFGTIFGIYMFLGIPFMILVLWPLMSKKLK